MDLKDIGSELKEDRSNSKKSLKIVMNKGIVIINHEGNTLQEELMEDLITIIPYPADKFYEIRSHKYRKVMKGVKKLL